MEDEPDSDLLDVRDKPTYSWFAFGGTAANRLLGLCTLRCVRTGADCAGAWRRGSGTPNSSSDLLLLSLVTSHCLNFANLPQRGTGTGQEKHVAAVNQDV